VGGRRRGDGCRVVSHRCSDSAVFKL